MPSANDLISRWPGLELATRRDRLQRGFQRSTGRLTAALPPYEAAARRTVSALWNKDASLWSADPDVQAKIANRLGWLSSPALMADSLDRLTTFAAGIRRDGVTDVVLLGMGGSSLAPEVLRSVIGPGPGGLRLHMIDSTDPAAVLGIETDVTKTVYIFASKSGTTIEPNSLAAHFQHALVTAGIDLSVGSVMALSIMLLALADKAGVPWPLVLFIGPAVGTSIGIIARMPIQRPPGMSVRTDRMASPTPTAIASADDPAV